MSLKSDGDSSGIPTSILSRRARGLARREGSNSGGSPARARSGARRAPTKSRAQPRRTLRRGARAARLEDLGRERVLLGVGLARHFQDPADYSQERANAAQGQLPFLGRSLIHACAYLPRRNRHWRSCFRNTSRSCPCKGRHVSALVLAGQQTHDTACDELVQVAKERGAPHSHRLRNLRGAQFMLRHQLNHQQQLPLQRLGMLSPHLRKLHRLHRTKFRSFCVALNRPIYSAKASRSW
jgi:hypothetical protein